MRMKFFRILPEMWASTWWLFSSSTRNIRLGKGSMTVATTSMASSLPLPSADFFFSGNGLFAISSISPRRPGYVARPRKNPRSIRRDRYRVLEVRRITAVGRHCGPIVVKHLHGRLARVDHRLDREHQAFLQPYALARRAVIRHL